jgi:peptidoglycan/LPS O-acetylase OafA/YrhL
VRGDTRRLRLPAAVCALVGLAVAAAGLSDAARLWELPLGLVAAAASLARLKWVEARWVAALVGTWLLVAPLALAGELPWPLFVLDVTAGLALLSLSCPRRPNEKANWQRWPAASGGF